MKKLFTATTLIGFSFAVHASPALAQYYDYRPADKAVEVDLSVLQEIDSRKNFDNTTHSTVPRAAAVEQMPLPLAGSPTPLPPLPTHPAQNPQGQAWQAAPQPMAAAPSPMPAAPGAPVFEKHALGPRIIKPTGPMPAPMAQPQAPYTPPAGLQTALDAADIDENIHGNSFYDLPAENVSSKIKAPPAAVARPAAVMKPPAPVPAPAMPAAEAHRTALPAPKPVRKMIASTQASSAPATPAATPAATAPAERPAPAARGQAEPPRTATAKPAPKSPPAPVKDKRVDVPVADSQETPPPLPAVAAAAPAPDTAPMAGMPQSEAAPEPEDMDDFAEAQPVIEPMPDTPPAPPAMPSTLLADEMTALPPSMVAEVAPADVEETAPQAPVEMAMNMATTAAAAPMSDMSLAFEGHSSDLTEAARKQLDAIVAKMQAAPQSRVQVHAFASGENGATSSARRISLSRALAVRAYLMDKQIKPNRVDVRGLGKETDHGPLERVDIILAP